MKFIKYSLIGAGIILLAGVTAYFTWFYNSYEHTLKLDAVSVYANQGEGYLITNANANIVDVESGSLIEAQHLFIRDGIINRIFTGSIPDTLRDIYRVTDATTKYIMPGMIDMHAYLNSGGLIPPDASTRTMALEQYARYGAGVILTLGGHGYNQEITSGLIIQQQNREIVAPVIFATGDILAAPEGYPNG